MKKIAIIFAQIIFLTGYLSIGQDVIYTIHGEKDGQVTHLDSLLFENLDNQSRFWITDLPVQHNYDVNLTAQGLVPVFDLNDFTESSFEMVRNIPGEAEIKANGGYIQNVNLRVYNLNGQVMYSKQISEVYPGEAIHLRVPGTGIYILNLQHEYGSNNFKIIGSSGQAVLSYNIRSSAGEMGVSNTQNIEASLKSRFYYNGFSYQPGDSLRITAFLGGHFTYPQGTRIAESESFGFIMLKSTADSTGISDRYKPIPNDLINILNYDTLAGTTTLVITTDTINFNFGDIITLDLDTTGIIQRIVRITKEDDEVILETETAYMDELFVNQSFKLNTVLMKPKTHLKSDASPLEIMEALTDDDGFIRPVKIIYHDDQGKKYEKSVLNGYHVKEHRENIVSFIEDFSKTDLYGAAGRDVHFYIDEGFAKLHADAVFEFDFGYEGELTEDTKVKRGDLNFFEFYLDAEAGFKTKLALDMKKSLKEEDTDRIFRMKRATAKFMVPPGIPVWITFSCDIYSFYNFTADASLHANWGFESNHTLQAGGKYERATNEFTPIYNYTPHNEIYPLNIEGEVNASARVEIYPRVDVRLYGFFGPYAEIAPYVQGHYNAKLQSQITFSGHETFLGWNSGIDLGLDLRVGTSLKFLLHSRDYGPTTINCFNLPLWASPVNIELLSNIPEQANPGQVIEIQVKITDLLNLPVTLCPVYFEGDGSFSKQLPITDINGITTITWILDATAGKKEFTAIIYDAEAQVIQQQSFSTNITTDDNGGGNGEPGEGVTDIDGNFYPTVIIGNQEWMAENLRVTKYNNGDAIPTGLNDTDWGNTTDGAYTIYNNDNAMLEAYGGLYNWYAVDDARGLCPAGWHVPSDAEWTELIDYVVAQGYPDSDVIYGAGNALKSCRQVSSPLGGDCATLGHPRWNSHSIHYGTDEFGFSALPGGERYTNGNYYYLGDNGTWWSSSEYSSLYIWYRSFYVNGGYADRYMYSKKLGFSVRCVKDLDPNMPATQSIAPQSVNSGGTKMSQSNGSLSFTVGELVVLTQTDSNGNTLGSGFIAGATITTVSIQETDAKVLDIKVFLNTTKELLNIPINHSTLEQLIVSVTDLQGKEMHIGKYEAISDTIGINTAAYAPGTYILSLKNTKNHVLGTYKIIKQ